MTPSHWSRLKTKPRLGTVREPVEVGEAMRGILAGYVDGPEVRHVLGERAYYSPSDDRVTLPLLEQFATAEGFASTALHELTHSTGHASRLDQRPLRMTRSNTVCRETPSVLAQAAVPSSATRAAYSRLASLALSSASRTRAIAASTRRLSLAESSALDVTAILSVSVHV